MAEPQALSPEAQKPVQPSIDTTSKLRQGFAPLPRERDKQEHLPEITVEFDPIAKKFLDILEQIDISWFFFDITRQSFNGSPQIRPKAYIRVFAPWRPNDDAWYDALKEFEEKYITTGIVNLKEVGLEIQDTTKKEWISSLRKHHPIFKHWDRLQEEALTLLEGSNWSILTPCRYGPNPESQTDQIVIYLGVENPFFFEEIVWELTRLCRKFNMEDVSVRVVETSVWAVVGGAPNVVGMDHIAAQALDTIRMGSSLNARDREESGTFGGLVKLRSLDGSSETFGVTNFHVIWDCTKNKAKNRDTGEGTEIEPSDIDTELQKYGIDPGRVYAGFKDGIPIYSPSHAGIRSLIERDKSLIKNLQEDLREKARIIEAETGGIWRTRDEKYKKQIEEKIERSQNQIQEFESSERKIGTVYAASGDRFQEKGVHYVLDWALLKLSPDKDFVNIIPSVEEVGESWYTPPKSNRLSELSTSKIVGGKIEHVLKRGRTTGVTVGVIDCLETMIRLSDTPMKAWKIYAPNMTNFCQPGDSGSFVLNHEGQLQGLLFGGWDDRFGLMIPIDAVVKDIETRTKKKLHL